MSMMAASSAGGVTLILKKEPAVMAAKVEESLASSESASPLEKHASSAATTLNDSNTGVGSDGATQQQQQEPKTGPSHQDDNRDNTFSPLCVTDSCSTEIPSSYAQDSTLYAKDGISVVDDALLSALSDRRERVGLLRLEQALVDFMRDAALPTIHVGGFANSMVLYPSQDGTTTTTPTPRLAGAGKQTKFQRLCLHRLADRFGIQRESVPDAEFNGGPGLIRLIKVAESKIPKQLLIDFTDHQKEENHPCSLTKNLSGLALSSSTSDNQKTPQRKMKIMKRSSSSFGSSGSLKDKSNNNNKGNKAGTTTAAASSNKGKNLSDKEKAYAEARARIFNNEEQPLEGSDPRSSIHSNLGNSGASSAFSSTYTSPSTTPPPPPNVASVVHVPLDIQASASDDQPYWQSQPQDRSGSVNSSNSNNNNSHCRPAAATGGGVSKVTWRNRRQEESDPDFQTRHRMQGPTPTANAAVAGGWASNTNCAGLHEYGPPNVYPPYHHHHHAPQHYYAGQVPPMSQQQAPPPTYYPHQHGQAYFQNSFQQQQQQQHSVLTPPGSGSSTPNRATIQQQRQGGYGLLPPSSQPYSHTTKAGSSGGSRPHGNDVNTGCTNDFPALG